jgi:hypothetical protein
VVNLPVNIRERMGFPAAGSPREVNIMSMCDLVGHRPMTFSPSCLQMIEFNRASVWKALALDKRARVTLEDNQWIHKVCECMEQLEVVHPSRIFNTRYSNLEILPARALHALAKGVH